MNITVIIPSKIVGKSETALQKCLSSIRTQKPHSFKINILVVTTSKIPLNYLKKVKILQVDSKSGFSDMNNLAIDYGFEHFNPDYFLLLNDDAWLENDFFSHLEKEITKDSADIILPLVKEANGKDIDSFGVEYFRSGYAKNCRSHEVATTLGSACCLVIKADLLKKMKKKYGFYFNPQLYFYMEDVELCIRAFMLGAQIVKSDQIIAYHQGSSTSGKRSRFTMYQTYRNILWVIILTWPLSIILRNLINILLVQGWVILYSTKEFGPIMYFEIWMHTLKNAHLLRQNRLKTIRGYNKDVSFQSMFSKYSFRTYHNITIPAL